ncbi:HAD family hydrolase [Stackebrandtia soli]|uniref:HAD family hydrolase n=1 Tax=Stackebrandtia soli TaxID=1892856 RepID=UPI0039ECD5A5
MISAPNSPLVIGFDLDMTLFDTRLSIGATLSVTAAELGLPLDVDLFLSNLGPPLDVMVGEQIPADRVEEFVAHYRAVYRYHGVSAAQLLPGARDSIACVHAVGGSTIVITGKNDHDANLHVDHEKLDVAHVIGFAWAETKTAALLKHSAWAYVGDHPADIAAARAAGARAVAVTTGSHGAEDFPDADIVLASLTEFPEWLKGQR